MARGSRATGQGTVGLVVAGCLAMAMVVGGLVWFVDRDGGPGPGGGAPESFEVADTQVTIDAPRDGGDLTVDAVDLGQQPPFATALSQAVRVDLTGGDLTGQATMTFPVDVAALPAGVDPAVGDLAVYTRDGPEAAWVMAAGVWDVDRRVLELTTTHFSDWVVAVTDVDALASGLYQREGPTRGWNMATAVFGERAELTCDATDIPTTYGVNAQQRREVQVCATQDPLELTWRVEIANNSPLPMSFTIPPDWEPQVVGDAQIAATTDLLVRLRQLAGDRRLAVGPGEKLVVDLPPGGLRRPTIIDVDVDNALWGSEMGSSLFDVLTARAGGPAGQGLAELNALPGVRSAADASAVLGCLSTEGREIEEALTADLDARNEAAAEAGAAVLYSCFGPVNDEVARLTDGGFFGAVGDKAKAVGTFFKKVLDVPRFLDSAGTFSRTYTMWLVTGTQFLVGGAAGRADVEAYLHGEVSLREQRPVDDVSRDVLLGPPDPDLGVRYQGDVYLSGLDYLGCNQFLSVTDLVARAGGVDASRSDFAVPYTSSGSVDYDLSVTIELFGVQPGRERAADARIEAGMPARCTEETGRFYGELVSTTVTADVVDITDGSLAMFTTDVVDPDLGQLPTQMGTVFARSGSFLLVMWVTATDGTVAQDIRELYARQAVALDDALGTDFTAR